MLTEMVGCNHKMEETVKAMQSEMKRNVQGTNSEGKETRTQINSLYQKEGISIQPEQNEETRIQKNEKRLRNFQDNFEHCNIQITGVPEGEEEQQEIENLFENIICQSGKGDRLLGSPGSSESPKEIGPKDACTKTRKYGPNERTHQSSRENTTMRQRESPPIRCTVQNTGY